MSEHRHTGWAAAADAVSGHYIRPAYFPISTDDPEPPYAVADAWTPPHELSMPRELCLRFRQAGAGVQPDPCGIGEYYWPELDDDLKAAASSRFAAANEAWWGLEITQWTYKLRRYGIGDGIPSHTDLHPGHARRKLAGTVQLSRPSEYAGGALVIEHWRQRYEMPRALGTTVVFPGWAVHAVEPVTRGERWVLLVNGWGPPLR